ncbi:MAG TPA: Ig-like domain-containing protein [Anaeromyxobacteraceae bacterium]|nr:Ig-like domain-containing protein [Anaeromyxobacteraceae bacterium]
MRVARRPVLGLLLAAALAFAGCGGDGGPSGPADVTPPTVTATSPGTDAAGVAIGASLTATFSEPMNAGTLSPSTFLLARGTTPVAGSVSYDGGSRRATFAPGSPLAHSTTYTASLTAEATDVAGNPLVVHTWSFTTAAPPPPPSGWNAQVTLGTPRDDFYVDIYGVDVDLNEGGTGIAAWEEDGDTTGTVWVAWYRAGAWEAAAQLSEAGTHAILPRVALNDAGEAVLAWEVVGHDGAAIVSRTVWARRFAGGAWTAAVRISDAPPASYTLYSYRPRAGIDAAGNALVAWDQSDSSGTFPDGIVASRFAGAGWSAPFQVSSPGIYAAWADAAVSTDGSAVVVWEQRTSPFSTNIWACIFDGAAWGAPQAIGPADLVDYEWATRTRVVMDAAGRAFAVWEESRTGGNRIGAAWFDPAVPTWSAPATLATSAAITDHLSFPSIATDGSGNAFAVWQSDVPGGSTADGAAARYDGAGGAWAASSFFETGGDVPYAVAAMDGAANGWALYSMSGMKARRDDPALGWQSVSSVGQGYATDAEANGSGMVIVGGYNRYYATTAFLISARASVYVP